MLPHFRSADVGPPGNFSLVLTAVLTVAALSPIPEVAMIKDVMVWLDGGISDEVRLAAVADIARRLDSEVVIGLFLNIMPLPGAVEGDVTAELIEHARKAGDQTEALLARRLQQLERPVEIRRFDVLADDIANIAARQARSADSFVAVRPMARWIPSGWSKASCSDRAGTCSWSPRRSGRRLPLIVSSSPGTAAGNRPEPWPRPCRFCMEQMRLRSSS